MRALKAIWKAVAYAATWLRDMRDWRGPASDVTLYECIVCGTTLVNPGVCPDCCGGLS
jgi:rubrerythrin